MKARRNGEEGIIGRRLQNLLNGFTLQHLRASVAKNSKRQSAMQVRSQDYDSVGCKCNEAHEKCSWISFSFNHRRPKVIRDHVKFIEFEVRMRVGAEKSCSQHACARAVRLDWMEERDISVSSIFSSFPPLFQWVPFFGWVSFIPRMAL